MRIISKYSDFYDGIQRYAPDADDVIYVRKTREYLTDRKHDEARRNAGQHELVAMLNRCTTWMLPTVERMHRGIVHFCGKRYPFWYTYEPTNIHQLHGFYNFDMLVAYLAKQEHAEKDPVYLRLTENDKKQPRRLRNAYYRSRRGHMTRPSWDKHIKYFERENARTHTNDDVFRYFNAPIIVYYEFGLKTRVVINERLNKLDFARVVDPYTAFQELSMFIGNNLASVEDPDKLVMTDVQRAATKGFDKWSFRKKVR